MASWERAQFLDRQGYRGSLSVARRAAASYEIVVGLASDPGSCCWMNRPPDSHPARSSEMIRFSRTSRSQSRDPAHRARHGRRLDVAEHISGCISARCWKRARGSRIRHSEKVLHQIYLGTGLIMAILEVQRFTLITETPICSRGCPAARARADPRIAGPQRRGQDDARELDRRFQSSAPGQDFFKGADITAVSSFETVRSGMGLVPQGRLRIPTLSVE